MSFLADDEYILLMDSAYRPFGNFSLNELKRFRDVGVKTVLFVETIADKFMPDDFKTFHWSYFEEHINRIQQAGMKCLISLWFKPPTYYYYHEHQDYYIKSINGYQLDSFSPWNERAQEKHNRLLRKIINQLSSEQVQFINGQCAGNEKILLNHPAYYDEFAQKSWNKAGLSGIPTHQTPEGAEWLKQSYLHLLKGQFEIFIDQPAHEIWYALSRKKAQNSDIAGHGCEWIDDYLDMFQILKPGAINHISFNYFPYGPEYWEFMRRDRRWGVNEFPGAEYCEGLRDGTTMEKGKITRPTGELAIEQGLRGMLVGPCHYLTHHEKLEQWMVDEVAKVHRQFEEARK